MDKSLLVKIVWLGAFAAVPVAILALQKPHAPVAIQARRVIVMDQPVAVDIMRGEIQGAAPVVPTPPAPPPPSVVRMFGAKITTKSTPHTTTEEPRAAAKELRGLSKPEGLAAVAPSTPSPVANP